MRAEINLLLQVQEKDIAIRSLQKERKQAPILLEESREGEQKTEKTLEQTKEELKNLHLQRKNSEIELESNSASIKKHEIQMFQVKTNAEYKALQNEIRDIKFAIGLQENKTLEIMEQIEKKEMELSKAKDAVTKAKDALKIYEKTVRDKIKAIDIQILEIRAERELLAGKVEEDILTRYNRIFNNKPDKAIVPIINKSCQGCHMKLPPNVINETKKAHKLIICENCARILYWPE